jgi:hypothetical protein
MRKTFSIVLLIVVGFCLSGCDFAWYVAKEVSNNWYRSVIPENTTTVEEIETLDGKHITIHGSYSIAISTGRCNTLESA